MKIKKKGLALVSVLLVVSLLVLSGCGGGKKVGEVAEPTKTSKDKTLTFVNTVTIPSLDPAKMNDEASSLAVVNMYDPLLYPKVAEKSMEPGPHLATSWTVSEDGKTYTFTLKQGVKFHDGTELEADDVVFSMDRMLKIKKGVSWLWDGVLEPGSTVAKDKYTVVLNLKKPFAPFLATLTQLFIVNKDQVLAKKQAGDFGDFGDYGQAYLETADAGSGPYKFESQVKGSELVMVKFPDYWKGWKPNQVEKAIHKVVPEEATVKLLIKSGEADMINQWVSVETFNELKKEQGIVVEEIPGVQLFHLPMNMKKKPTDNINVRMAIAYAFDYETANKTILDGAAPAQGPVPNKAYGHNDEIQPMKRDVQKAKDYLAKSGYKPGELTVDYVYVDSLPSERKIGLLLQSNLEEIGINVNVIGVPWVKMTEMAVKPETSPNLAAVFLSLRYPSPDAHTFGQYHPSSWGSYRSMSFYKRDDVSKVLESARDSVKVEDQIKYYKQSQAMVMEDMPSVYIGNPLHRIAYQSRVKGYVDVGLLGYDLNFYHLTLQD